MLKPSNVAHGVATAIADYVDLLHCNKVVKCQTTGVYIIANYHKQIANLIVVKQKKKEN